MSTPTPGRRAARRAAPRPRPSFDRSSLKGVALVAVAALLLLAAGIVEAQPEPAAAPTEVPIDQVTTACLGSPVDGESETSTLAAPLPDAPDAGSVMAGSVGAQPKAQGNDSRGEQRKLDAPGSGSALMVTASDVAAIGRSTFLVDRPRGRRALATQECLPARSRWWFAGAGAGLDHQSQLVLTNVDPGPAVVDVVVNGPGGVVDSVGTRGITLPPGEVRTIDLLDIAPKSDELGVRVEASRGRVVAALADSFAAEAGAEPGQEWLPPQEETSRLLRLAPLPRKADRRTLVVANPAGREALVDVQISGAAGSFAPTGVDALRVPPGAVVTTDIKSAVGDEASGVLLRSTVPVSATVRSSSGSDVAYAGAVRSLDGPATAVLPSGTTGAVNLTAGEKGGTARVVAYSSKGKEVDSGELDLPPRATLAWSSKRAADYVVVTPTEGRIFGGVTLAGDGVLSQVALRPLPVTLRRPAVVPLLH